MLNIPEEIKELFRADNISHRTTKKFKLTFYDDTVDTLYPYETLFPDESLFPSEHGESWLVIENDRIEKESLTITEALSGSEDLEFGSCESAVLEIVVADVIEDITGKEFTLTVEIGGYEMALGIYTVDSFVRQADRRKRKITAYDRMRWFNTDVSDWYNDLTFPTTLKTFRDSLCDYIGIQQQQTNLLFDSLEITKTIEPSQISGLDVLKAICQVNGCFGHIDKTGQLTYIHLQQTGLYPSEDLFPYEELYPSEFGGDGEPTETVGTYKSMTYEDYLVDGINGLNIREQEGDIGASVGENDNVYAVEGNFLVYGKTAVELLNIAESLLSIISGRSYRPCQLECNAMPWFEVGDAIIAPTRDDIVETFVMKRVTKGCQAMMDTIESTGAQKREETFAINRQIIQLEGKTAVIEKNVNEVSVKLTDLGKRTEAQFEVTAEKISSEIKRATESEGELSARITQTAEQINLKVSKGEVSSQISIESGGVSIKGNRFSWESTNSSMTADGTLSCKNGHFSGEITASTGKIGGFVISGNNLKSSSNSTTIEWGDFYVNGDELYAGSVTISNEGVDIGYIGSIEYGHWESDTGDIYVNEIYATDNSWMKGWGLFETVQELWEYVHGGGWNPCGSDSCSDYCDGGSCGCDDEECDGGCEIECDCADCDGSCDGGCDTICSGDGCDGAEGPGCV